MKIQKNSIMDKQKPNRFKFFNLGMIVAFIPHLLGFNILQLQWWVIVIPICILNMIIIERNEKMKKYFHN